jgi:hypothetical protein
MWTGIIRLMVGACDGGIVNVVMFVAYLERQGSS